MINSVNKTKLIVSNGIKPGIPFQLLVTTGIHSILTLGRTFSNESYSIIHQL